MLSASIPGQDPESTKAHSPQKLRKRKTKGATAAEAAEEILQEKERKRRYRKSALSEDITGILACVWMCGQYVDYIYQDDAIPRQPSSPLATEIFENLSRFPHCILLTRVGQFYEVNRLCLICKMRTNCIAIKVILRPSRRGCQTVEHQVGQQAVGRRPCSYVRIPGGTAQQVS